MGIETNFGNYLGKMDIISSLATLSFDQRRSEFFTKELITILKLIDNKIIDHNILFKALGGLFMGVVLMGNQNKPISGVDIDKLIEQIISNPREN